MGQDLRELLQNDRGLPVNRLSQNHEDTFFSKLEKELPVTTKKISTIPYRKWLGIASGFIVIFCVGLSYFISTGNEVGSDFMPSLGDVQNAKVILPKETSSLAAISPEYEKAEQYFLKNIKVGLSKITIDNRNQELVQSFMRRLKQLNDEYKRLNIELMELGPNPQSIQAMMENLTLRVSLLNRLNSKLRELDSIENENYIDLQA